MWPPVSGRGFVSATAIIIVKCRENPLATEQIDLIFYLRSIAGVD